MTKKFAIRLELLAPIVAYAISGQIELAALWFAVWYIR